MRTIRKRQDTADEGRGNTTSPRRISLEDANSRDLKQFENWYLQAGTPTLTAEAGFTRVLRGLSGCNCERGEVFPFLSKSGSGRFECLVGVFPSFLYEGPS